MDRLQLYLWWSLLLEMEVFFILSTTCTWVVMFFQFLVDLWEQHMGRSLNLVTQWQWHFSSCGQSCATLILELKLLVLNEPFRRCNIRTHQVCPHLEQISDVVLWSPCTVQVHDRINCPFGHLLSVNFRGSPCIFFYNWVSPCTLLQCTVGDTFTEHGAIGKIFVAKKIFLTPPVLRLQKWFLHQNG